VLLITAGVRFRLHKINLITDRNKRTPGPALKKVNLCRNGQAPVMFGGQVGRNHISQEEYSIEEDMSRDKGKRWVEPGVSEQRERRGDKQVQGGKARVPRKDHGDNRSKGSWEKRKTFVGPGRGKIAVVVGIHHEGLEATVKSDRREGGDRPECQRIRGKRG